MLYIANVNMNPWEKDGNGFISKVNTDGTIAELEWITGLHGPKGMGIIGSSLYVNDIDEVVKINTGTGDIINRYQVTDENSNLNDITVGDNGTLYISGSGNQTVYQLIDGKIEVLISGDLGRPNGLWYENGDLFILGNVDNILKSLKLESNTLTNLTEGIGSADGMIATGNGDYVISDWQGQLFHISQSWKLTTLLDTREENINAADIEYIPEKDLLLVPTFNDNRVVAYSLYKE